MIGKNKLKQCNDSEKIFFFPSFFGGKIASTTYKVPIFPIYMQCLFSSC